MPINSLIRRLMTKTVRNQTTRPIRQSRDVGRRIEELEDRTTPTTGLTPADQQVAAAYGQLPLSFESNKGQTASQVQYLSQGSGYTLFLTSTSSVLSLAQPSASSDSGTPNTSPSTTTSGVALAMNLVGSNPQAPVAGQDQIAGTSNYFIGNSPSQWQTNVTSYGKVAYQNVYPGINLVYYGNQQQLEYDFDVLPGANPNAIRFNVQGAENVSLDASGDLVMQTASGDVLEHAPTLYQEVGGTKQAVAGQFVLLGATEVGFQVGAYNASLPLIIDPILLYSTFLGGNSDDGGIGIAVDGSGNAYITGEALSTNFPTTMGAFQSTLGSGSGNAFVTKLNASGSALVYSTFLGGNNQSEGQSIAVDGSGDAYITGFNFSTNFPVTAGAFQTTAKGEDAFVTKLNANGTALVYSTYLGGSSNDHGTSIALDGSGDAYITGGTYSTDFPTTAGAYQTTFPGSGGTTFLTKLNPTGTALVYSTFLGGSNGGLGFSIAVNGLGDAYITGGTGSTDFPTTAGAFQTTLGGSGGNAFVTEFNPSGTALVFSTYLGGSGFTDSNVNSGDYARDIALDGSGDVYITGQTTSTNFPTTAGAFQTTLGGSGGNVFVTEFNPSGTALVFSTYLGGSGTVESGVYVGDTGYGIALEGSGDVYITGQTTSTNFPTTAGAIRTTLGSSRGNAFISELTANGSALDYSTYLGGTIEDGGLGIAVDGSGNAYVTGYTFSSNFPTTAGAFQTTQPGNQNGFVTKLGIPALTYGDDLTSGVLTITQAAAGNDALTLSLSAGTYTLTDTGGQKFGTPTGTGAGSVSGGGTSSITISSSAVTAITITLGTGTNSVTLAGTGGAAAAPITVNTGSNAADTIAVTGAFSDSGGVSLTSGAITTSGSLTTAGGAVNLQAADGITLGAPLTSNGGAVTLNADSDANGTGTLTLAPAVMSGFQQQAELTAADGAANDEFGTSVAVSGTTAVVGARFHQVGSNTQQGSAYVYTLSGGSWVQQAELTAADGAADDVFGTSVALSGTTVVVGAYAHKVGSNGDQGSAYVYTLSGGSWVQQAELTSSDGAASDEFGISVALSGTTVVVGARYHLVGSHVAQGAAYVDALQLPSPGGQVAAGAGPVTITAAAIALNNTITSTGMVSIAGSQPGTAIDLGGTATGLELTQAALGQITAGIVQVGNGTAGPITVSGPVAAPAGWNTLDLVTAAGVAQSAPLGVGTLGVTAATGITLTNAGNVIATISATNTTSGNVSLTNTASPLTITGITQTGGGNVVVNDTGSITTSGAISAGSAGSVSLTASVSIVVGTNITGGTGGTTLLAAGSGTLNTIGVTVQNGAVVSATGSGSVSVTGRGGPGSNGFVYGVYVTGSGSMITSSGSGTVTVTGTGGSGAGTENCGVRVDTSSQITSGGGTVQVIGQGGGGDGGFEEGVLVYGQITSGGAGIVTVTGTGSGSGGSGYGVDVESPGEITSGGVGTVAVNGTGGSQAAGFEVGVRVGGGTITSGGGDVSVTGLGGGMLAGTGSGSGVSEYGVDVQSSGEITSSGAGTVMVNGTGGPGPSYEIGVRVGSGKITSGGGDVSVTGLGGGSGSGVMSQGVDLEVSGQITSGGSGTVTVSGTGGSGAGIQNYGVSVFGPVSVLTSGGGAVSITATGDSTSEAIFLQSGGAIASGNNAPITLTADSLSIDNTSTIDSGTGPTTIVTRTTSTLIALGGAEILTGSPLTLGLSAAEIAQVTAGTLTIGNTQSGEVDISTAVAFSSPVVNVTTASGNAIAFSGTGSLAASGNVTLTTSGTGAITSTTAATDVTPGAGTISLKAGSGGIGASGSPIIVSGTNLDATTSGNGNQFLTAAGSITIDPTGLTAGTGTEELEGGTFILGDDNPINANANLNVNEATFAVGAFNETVNTVTLMSGTISGTTGLLTSTNTFQVQSGMDSAILAGANGLTKTTGGTVTLSGANTYGGATTVNGGTLADGVANALPTGTALTVNNSGTFDLVGFPQQVASITGSGIIADSGSASTLTVTGGGNFSGDITGTASLSTTGSGILTLGGDDTYTGATTITSGTLLVTGNLTESAVSVLPSGTIGGTGTVQGLSISGDLAPGVNGVGTLTGEGNTSFTGTNAEFSVQLDGTGSGSSNLLAESGGTVNLGTQTTLVVTQTVPTSLGQVFTIISGAGNISGTFVGLANNATFVNDGIPYRITYSTGSVTLTDVGSALTPPTLPPGEVGLGYDQTITPVAGSPPATLSVSGVTNPTGLAISGSGTDTISVSGTPTATGTVSFTVTPTYASGTGVGTVYSFTVNPAIILTPATLPTGEVGLAYSQSLTASGGSGAITLALSGVTNTTGLTISGNGTGTISIAGTPTSAGTVSFTVTPTDSIGTGSGKLYSFTVAPPVSLNPTTLPGGEKGLVYNKTITASGGSGTVSLALSGVTNTTGLTISGNGTGTISLSGTPDATGTVTFTVTPTDSVGTGTGTVYSFTVSPSVVLSPSTLPGGEAGIAYSQSITSTGGAAPVTLGVSGVTNPTGLTISGSGTGTITLTGTPTSSGTVTFTVTPTDMVGASAGTIYSFTVSPAIILSPGTLPTGQVALAYNQTITDSGGNGTITLALSGVTNSTGLTISGNGTGTITLTGTPTTSGTVSFTVTPTDSIGTGPAKTYSFIVASAVALTPTSLPSGEVGAAYSQSITSTGGAPPVTLAVSGVTNTTGLIISGSGTGTIRLSGTPTSAGTLTFTVTPTSAAGTTTGTNYTFTVDPAIVLSPTTLPGGEVGFAYHQSISGSGGSGTITLNLSGVTNTTGLTISGSGTGSIGIIGTPTAAGTVSFTVTPSDAIGTGTAKTYSFTIAPPVSLNPTTLPGAEEGLVYNKTITASGGSGTISLALSGVTNTTGLTISGNGTGAISLSGTPSAGGTVTFTVTPTDSIGTTSGTVYSFTVSPQVVLSPSTLPGGEAGITYSRTIAASGGAAPVTLAVSGVTNTTGLTISGNGTGTISVSGTPTSSGTVTFTVTPTDKVGTGSGTIYSFSVNPATVLSPTTLPAGQVGLAYNQSITSSGGSGHVTLALSSVTNTTGLTITGNGTGTISLSGTPTSSGTVSFNVTPGDSIGAGQAKTYSFTVASPVTLLPTTLPAGEVGQSYNHAIVSSGGVAPVTLTVLGITNTTGVSIEGSGTGMVSLSGVPTSAGTVTFTVTPSDPAGTETGTLYSFTIDPALALTPTTLSAAHVGTSYSQTITSTGGVAPVTLAVSSVTNATGLTISGTGTGTISISGTPTSAGIVSFIVTPTDGTGTGEGTEYSLDVNGGTSPPPPTGTPQPVLVGGLPNGMVQVYTESNGTYTLQETLQPFGNIPTDVRTAVGDVNGDGIPDYIFAIGPSPADANGATIAATATEFQVMVLSGASGNPVLVQPFDPFLPNPGGSPFTAGGFVSAGDFLNNGRDQIVVSPDQQGGPRIAIYDMNGAATAGPQPATPVGVNTTEINPGSGLTRINNFLSVNPDFRGGARTAVGDLNGDGTPDLAIAAGYGGGPAVLVINGMKVPTTTGFTPSDDLIGDFFAFNSTLRDGAYLAIGDVLGNGQQDLILGPGAGGPAEVEVISGAQIVNSGAVAAIANPVALFTPTGLGPDGSGVRVAAAGSGVGDQVNVVVGAGRNMPGLAKVYSGTGFTSGSTSEPTGGQILDPFGGGTLTDGIFVG